MVKNKVPILVAEKDTQEEALLDEEVFIELGERSSQRHWKKIASYCAGAFGLMLMAHLVVSYLPYKEYSYSLLEFYQSLDKNFHWMVLAGFLAQLVDGALGMGYGVTSASILLSTGIYPAAISGSIQTAEMFASGVSGYSHYKFGNVNKKLFKVLVIPGVIGALPVLVYWFSWVKKTVGISALFWHCTFYFLGLKLC